MHTRKSPRTPKTPQKRILIAQGKPAPLQADLRIVHFSEKKLLTREAVSSSLRAGGEEMNIVTLHTIDKNPETNEVLADVIATMRTMGAPVIRCFYHDGEGVYMAAEGCHRIEAAHVLGLTPVLDILDLGDIDADFEENPAPADILEEMGDCELSMAELWNKIERYAVRSNNSQWYTFED